MRTMFNLIEFNLGILFLMSNIRREKGFPCCVAYLDCPIQMHFSHMFNLIEFNFGILFLMSNIRRENIYLAIWLTRFFLLFVLFVIRLIFLFLAMVELSVLPN